MGKGVSVDSAVVSSGLFKELDRRQLMALKLDYLEVVNWLKSAKCYRSSSFIVSAYLDSIIEQFVKLAESVDSEIKTRRF